jgi:hypothetical protein
MKLTLDTKTLPSSLRQIVEEAYGKKEKANRVPALNEGISAHIKEAGALFGTITLENASEAIDKINDSLRDFFMSGVIVRDRKEKVQE